MTNNPESANLKNKELTKVQQDFLDFCRKLGYGKVEIIIRDGEPVYATQVKQDTKFG